MNPTQNTTAEAVATTPAALLRAAADYINTHGWHQGALYAPNGTDTPPACALGALFYAAHGDVFRGDNEDTWFAAITPALTALGDWLHDAPWECDTTPDHRLTVADWNDDQHTTINDILGSLRAAADQADTTTATAGGAR